MTSTLIEKDITLSTHVYLAIATTCVAWLLIAKPSISLLNIDNLRVRLGTNVVDFIKNDKIADFLTKYIYIILVHLILCIILPAIYFSRDLESESESKNFMIMKIAALIIGTIGREILLIVYNQKDKNYIFNPKENTFINDLYNKCFSITKTSSTAETGYLVLTVFMTVALGANIGEAVYGQINERDKIIDGSVDVPQLNLINGICGIVQMAILIILLFKGNRMGLTADKNILKLVCNLDLWFILAYTFWNLLFVIQRGGEIPVLLFFCVTLFLPLIVHILGYADWLQTRGMTLLFMIVLTLGMGYGDSNILPVYNKINDPVPLKEVPNDDFTLKNIYENKEFKIFLLVITCIFTFISLVKTIKN